MTDPIRHPSPPARREADAPSRAGSAPPRPEQGAPTPLVLAGPTAVGKTEIACHLASRLGGEIVSVDSMQVYRGMDIGTDKPGPEIRRQIPHHLIDVAELTEPFDAARFVTLAREAVAAIGSRGKVPILCGGTGLYLRAFLEGLGSSPAPDPALRRALEQRSLEELVEALRAEDPAAAERIDLRNPRRVIRALEVRRLMGASLLRFQAPWGSAPVMPYPAFGLKRPHSEWHERIAKRVDTMFADGLVAETARLLDQGLRQNPNALQAIGYRQVVDYLEGRISLDEAIDRVKSRTRRFGKHQLTWFRRQMALQWVELTPEQPAPGIVDELIQRYDAWLSGSDRSS